MYIMSVKATQHVHAGRRGCRYITRTYGIVGGVPMGGDGFVEVSWG